MGFELFDKMSWGQTEFDEKVTYQRALEGELERTIQTLSDVESARVHIVMPTDSVFADNQRGAKASVILKLRHDSLSKDAVLAISRLVSGAVDELKPEDVSIVDADSDRSLGLGHDGQADGEATEATLARAWLPRWSRWWAWTRIRASVNVDYDQGSTDEMQTEIRSDGERRVERTEDARPGWCGRALSRGCSGNCQQRAGQLGQDNFPRSEPGTVLYVGKRGVWGE